MVSTYIDKMLLYNKSIILVTGLDTTKGAMSCFAVWCNCGAPILYKHTFYSILEALVKH